ncbi:hypothetical protein [Bradyrhizobium sp.]
MKLWATFLQIFQRRREEPDRAVIDVSPYRDSLKRLDEGWQELAKSQDRVASQVRQWALECIRTRDKAPFPSKLPKDHRDVLLSWLDGIYVPEIYSISKADRFAVLHHIYGDRENRIADVRPVMRLKPTILVWPTPVQVVDPQSERSAGGGPKVKRYR